MTEYDRICIAHSVYNAVSLSGRDMTAAEIVEFLHKNWDPKTSKNAARVDVVTVNNAIEHLGELVHRDGDLIRVVRNDNGRGPGIAKTPDNLHLMRVS